MMDPDADDATDRKARRVKAPLRGIIAATALGGALALTACSSETRWSGSAGTAAVVDGTRITTDDAMVAAQQINEQFKASLQSPLTTGNALNYLIVAPAYISVAQQNGIPSSAATARTELTTISDPADSTVTLIQVNDIASTLSSWGQATATQAKATAVQKQILAAIGKQHISVSPQFGTFDATSLSISPSKPNWISKTVPATSATDSAGS